ncbi:MAG: hypothetical protein PUC08_03020, partial [Bacteroidales bacterium]|nr:hypothetical protein [Bacteroidales bacterium]
CCFHVLQSFGLLQRDLLSNLLIVTKNSCKDNKNNRNSRYNDCKSPSFIPKNTSVLAKDTFELFELLKQRVSALRKMSASHSARYSEENNMTFRVLNHRMLDTDNCKYYIEKTSDIAYEHDHSF